MKGKVIVLTGASGGIGAALAHELAQAGAKLILVGRNEQALSELSTELGDGHTVLAADISTADGRNAILSHCNGLESGVDILLNNAGISGFVSFDKMDEDKIMSLININLTSTILLTQGMLPILSKKPASKIIVIGSAFGGIAFPGFTVYSASKFGLRGFTQALSRELADSSVDVRYFAPRATKTAFNDKNVDALNEALSVSVDEPSQVAKEFMAFINSGKKRYFVGWPEKLFSRINGAFPSLVDKAIGKQLATIKRCLPK